MLAKNEDKFLNASSLITDERIARFNASRNIIFISSKNITNLLDGIININARYS